MFPRSFALSVASEFLEELAPVCRRIEIAGSIRREKPEVNNVDIAAVPRVVQLLNPGGDAGIIDQDLLGAKLAYLHACGWFTVHSNGPRVKRLSVHSNGPRVKRFSVHSDGPRVERFIGLDERGALPITIRITDEESWWTSLLVTTGSHGHNIAMSCRALDRGMRLRGDGSGLFEADGTRVVVNSEEEIFAILGLEYRPPSSRV